MSVIVAAPPSTICIAPSPRGVEALANIPAISEPAIAIAGSATASVSLMKEKYDRDICPTLYDRNNYMYICAYTQKPLIRQ